jgi:hypothetical protein
MTNPWIQGLPGPRLLDVIAKHGDDLKARHHTDDVYFAIWLHALDRAVQRRVLVSYDDLEDWDYWSAYEGGQSPKEAALDMLTDAGWASAVDIGVIE